MESLSLYFRDIRNMEKSLSITQSQSLLEKHNGSTEGSTEGSTVDSNADNSTEGFIDINNRHQNKDLVLKNLRLVIFVAKKFYNTSISQEDLLSAGNIGLIKAAERFDRGRGYKFSTYAVFYVRSYIQREILLYRPGYQLPVYVEELLSKYKNYAGKSQVEGCDIDDSDAARELKVPIKKVREMKRLSLGVVSLNDLNAVGEENHETIEDTAVKMPYINLDKVACKEIIKRLMKGLPRREQRLLKLRYGLGKGKEKMTLKQVSKILHLSRERIRQIEEELLVKLRQRINQQKIMRNEFEF